MSFHRFADILELARIDDLPLAEVLSYPVHKVPLVIRLFNSQNIIGSKFSDKAVKLFEMITRDLVTVILLKLIKIGVKVV